MRDIGRLEVGIPFICSLDCLQQRECDRACMCGLAVNFDLLRQTVLLCLLILSGVRTGIAVLCVL